MFKWKQSEVRSIMKLIKILDCIHNRLDRNVVWTDMRYLIVSKIPLLARACLITLHSNFEIFQKGHPAVEFMIDRRIFER